ncbi:hypothetical protein QAD02_010304 [Eretmocerus hayati]|uniref:Uncharacterized protein n=1 Tax=Eretmocerus hayati TaxID=131215 RepID=A0ACC2NCI4_9HYME|nr:hypothetical protein QAD02_010304 [Eretmocerus hayati]
MTTFYFVLVAKIPDLNEIANSYNDPARIREQIAIEEQNLDDLVEKKNLLEQQIMISAWKHNMIHDISMDESHSIPDWRDTTSRVALMDDSLCIPGPSNIDPGFAINGEREFFYNDGNRWLREEIKKLEKKIVIQKRDLTRLRLRLHTVDPPVDLQIEGVAPPNNYLE